MKYVHTNIVSEDWSALADFYVAVFGCESVPPQRAISSAWLARGTGVANAALEGIHLRLPGYGDSGPTLEIYQYHEMVPNLTPVANRKGLGHLAFLVEDVAQVRDAVLQHGGSALGALTEADIDGVGHLTFIYMADPEGNILEIQHWA